MKYKRLKYIFDNGFDLDNNIQAILDDISNKKYKIHTYNESTLNDDKIKVVILCEKNNDILLSD